MSQHDLTIDNQGFPAFRADLNNALQALGSTQSGTSAPSPTFANQLWYDTTNNQLKIRNEDNDAWITLLTLDQSADSVSQLATAIAVLSAGTAGAPALTTTGDTNTGIFFPAADTIAFTEGGAEAMRITSDGRLGINTTSPANPLEVNQGSSSSVAGVKVSGSTWVSLDLVTTNADSGARNWRLAGVQNSFGLFELMSGSAAGGAPDTTVLSVKKGSSIALEGASSQTGIGITFPATQSASSNANTLDDYEEGTFTPTIGGTVSDGTASYSTQQGQYTKIGDRVFFSLRVGWSSGTGSGNMVVRGLPFTQINGSGDIPYAVSECSDIAWSANYMPTPVGQQNGTYIYLNQSRIGGSGTAANTAYDAGGFISITGHYKIN